MLIFLIGVSCLVFLLFTRHKMLWLGISLLLFANYFQLIQLNFSPFSLNFSSHHLFVFICFILGILLIIAELYIPDMGVIGILGLITCLSALNLYIGNIREIILLLLLSFCVVIIVSLIFLKSGQQISVSPAFILNHSLDKQSGYSSSEDHSHLINKTGIVTMDLRPVGKGMVEGQVYEFISEGEYISKGTQVKVVKVTAGSIYVKKEED